MSAGLMIPKDASEVLRDKLRGAFLEVMPEGQLDDIIKHEWVKFFDVGTPTDTFYYSREQNRDSYKDTSPCIALIRDEIKGHVREQLRKLIEEELDKLAPWRDDKTFLARVIEESRDALANAQFTQLVHSVVMTIRNNPPQY